MKEGTYLLALPGDDFAVPCTLKHSDPINGNGVDIIASVNGVQVTSNLPKGYRLIPLVPMTKMHLATVHLAIEALRLLGELESKDNSAPIAVLLSLVEREGIQ